MTHEQIKGRAMPGPNLEKKMKLHDAIEMAAGLASEEDELQVVGRIQGEWVVAGWEDAGRIAEMCGPTFRVDSGGVDQGHIQRGEITENLELPETEAE